MPPSPLFASVCPRYNYLPDPAFVAALYVMFVAEIIVPAFFFAASDHARAAAAATTVALQLGIAATGNYGTFNLLTSLLCLPLLTSGGGATATASGVPPLTATATATATAGVDTADLAAWAGWSGWLGWFGSYGSWGVGAVLLPGVQRGALIAIGFLGLVSFPTNSYNTNSTWNDLPDEGPHPSSRPSAFARVGLSPATMRRQRRGSSGGGGGGRMQLTAWDSWAFVCNGIPAVGGRVYALSLLVADFHDIVLEWSVTFQVSEGKGRACLLLHHSHPITH